MNTLPSVLIVGTGLTGAICCYQIRRALGDRVRIEAIDMARGAGGRMSTTRQTIGKKELKANTGAQYASCFSPTVKQALSEVCRASSTDPLDIQEMKQPMERSLHFKLEEVDKYSHFMIPGGTNNLVKQFLYAGRPDVVSFETRLTKLWKRDAGSRIAPEFDLRRCNNGSGELSNEFDMVVLALPPKDAAKLFQNNNNARNIDRHKVHDSQSQADLHRHYNKQNRSNKHAHVKLDGVLPVTLGMETSAKMRGIVYVGRYSLVLWFDHDAGTQFAKTVVENWQKQIRDQTKEEAIDAVFLQEKGKVLVAQSTVRLWKKYSGVSAGGGRGGGKQKNGNSAGNSLSQIVGGGRQAVRNVLTTALEQLASSQSSRVRIPRVAHAKLLNWRTSQVEAPLNGKEDGVLSAENGRIILTGDWVKESSLEGCYQAGVGTAKAVHETLKTRCSG